MPNSKPNPGRREALRQQGTLHPRPEAVTDPLFQSGEFFDPHDLVQVKYEMLRRAEVDGAPVSQAASAFGFSRPTFYQAQGAFARAGLPGLIPLKKGPRRAHKLTAEILEFVTRLQAEQPDSRPAALAWAIRQEFGVKVHPRSVERALARHQKKRLS
jgi:transposase